MAEETINDETEVTSMTDDDWLLVWLAGSAVQRKIKRQNALQATLAGKGTINTGGYTVTIPGTGTAALKTGSPSSGDLASWAGANTLQDAGFATSDIARLSQSQTFTANQTVAGRMQANRFFTESVSSLADDTATSVDPDATAGLMFVNVTTGGLPQQRAQAFIGYRCTNGQTAFIYVPAQPAANPIETTTGLLGGTTGNDNVITISPRAADENIYIENRTGTTITMKITFLG